jgi:hypothetical protein
MVYVVEDLAGEEVLGTFYEREIQKVIPSIDKEYKIEKILARRGRGTSSEVLVMWRNYSDKFNTWIKSSAVNRITK